MRLLDNRRNGILSLADARRDANLSRAGARDQYEADVADFMDNEITDIENNFMSSGDTFKNPSNIQSPSIPLDIPQEDVFLPPSFNDYLFDELPIDVPPPAFNDEPIYTPPNIDFTLPPIADDRIIDTPPPMDLPPPAFDDEPIYVPPPSDFLPPVDNIYDDVLPPSKPPIDDLIMPPVDVPPPFRPPVDNFPPFEPPVDVPPPFTPPPFTPPMDPPFTPPIEPPIDIPPPGYRPPGDGPPRPPFDDGIVYPPYDPPFDDGIIDPPYDPPQDPPQDPPYTPPVDTPAPRRMYRPPTDFSSGAPKAQLPYGISALSFGQAPGFERKPPIFKPTPPPNLPPKRPPHDIRIPPPPDDRLMPDGMKFGGPLNAGIMRLPQSQQGDTMTTRIFQNAFKPRR